MRGPRPQPVSLTPQEREQLEAVLRRRKIEHQLALRVRIILLAAEGKSTTSIAEQLRCTRNTVVAWRKRWLAEGYAGLSDRDRPGRPRGASDEIESGADAGDELE